MSSPPIANSILNSINPYASLSQSTYPNRRREPPDSPSTLLLKELSGESSQSPRTQFSSQERRNVSPTPKSLVTSTDPVRDRSVVQEKTAEDDEDNEDDDGPPASLLFGTDQPGDRTPRSPSTPLASSRIRGSVPAPRITSPGPFQPPSSSASPAPSRSISRSRSRSTSPGPSTNVSIDASSTLKDIGSGSISSDPSTFTEAGPSFRGLTVVNNPILDALNESTSTRAVRGYLDPPVAGVQGAGVTGAKKGKTRSKGGRKYQQVIAEEHEVDGLINETASSSSRRNKSRGKKKEQQKKNGLNAYEKALWKWVNVEDLDGFLMEVYDYYKGKGFWCIILSRFLNLVTTFFVIGFSTFLFSCIDYSKLTSEISSPNSIGRLDDVLIGQCITSGSFTHMLFIASVGAVYLFQLTSFIMSVPRLLDMYQFYTNLLGIPDADIQTLPWPEIVRLIGEIRKHNPVTSLSNGNAGPLAAMVGEEGVQETVKKLDAHDVANRILRQENYLIALFNKELLDLRVRIPIPHPLLQYIPLGLLAPTTELPSTSGKRERRFLAFGKNALTKALEWNLRFCLMGYLFDKRGQVKREFIKSVKRADLVEGLRKRFIFMGGLNLILSPFIIIYLLIYSFFRYFEEYHKNPSSIGSRAYTPYAQWKFREFNELPHLFERRLDRSYPVAKEYIDQFPKERTALIMRFVAFVAGSFAAVLLVASLIDPDLFLHFEITPRRTVLFYLGLFGGILAFARGMIPEENLVFDPEASLREVVYWTHYLPNDWKGKLHSQMVHQEFGLLFAMKITIFFNELLSVLLTPFVLFFSLPLCSGAIIDFFREFTIHVEGIGYVCSFAVFDFRRNGDLGKDALDTAVDSGLDLHTHPANDGLRSPLLPPNPTRRTTGSAVDREREKRQREMHQRERSRLGLFDDNIGGGIDSNDKMTKSFLHFKATHPDWIPDPATSMVLDKLVDKHRAMNGTGIGIGMGGSMYQGGGRGLGIGGINGISGMGGSVYGNEESIKERSRSYDRAWAKTSHLLKSPPLSTVRTSERGRIGHRSRTNIDVEDRNGGKGNGKEGLGDVREEEDQDQESDGGLEAQRLGYEGGFKTRRDRQNHQEVVDEQQEEEEEEERERRRYMNDRGVVGILQQIMGN